ncbi:MAG: hypothetical protein FWG14_01270 [Peptococcaceae bacterium]|nr:hypothetical protein [Peptococcaceae bacterium]
MKVWKYQYGENIIEVRNKDGLGSDLFVNGQKQDEKLGIRFSSTHNGKLDSGEEVKASLGGTWKIECSLFVDNKLQTPIEERKIRKKDL